MTASESWAAAGSNSLVRRWLEYVAVRLALPLLARAPLPLAMRISRALVHGIDRAVPRLRRTALANLSLALPDADPSAITDGVFQSIARLLVVFARLPAIDRQSVRRWIRYEGLENYLQAKQRGRGVLIATAHFGNWELSAFAHALLTEPMHVVARPLDNPHIDAFVQSRRTLSGNQVIRKRDAARSILSALKNNHAVGILIDQNALPEEAVFVPFFGRPAAAHVAFAKLAHRSGAPVIPGYAVWSENEQRYVLVFEPEVPMTGDPVEDTARIQHRLEQAIRRYPDQWLWIHRRWKTQPASNEQPARTAAPQA
jgi:KDO2-lipid IV(A) lauroyltransferase